MKKIRNPYQIYWFVTLPQTMLTIGLAALLINRAHSGALWMLIISAVVNAAFTGYAIVRRKQPAIDKAALIVLVVAGCVLLSASVLLLDSAALFGIRLRLAALLFNLITALFAVTALAQSLRDHSDAGRRILALVALPFVWFLGFNIATGVRLETVAIILVVAGALAAVFLLLCVVSTRGAKALAASDDQKHKMAVLYSIFSIGLPLVGLTLNATISNLCGDFSSPWFFAVPILNGVLLLLPPFSDKRLRLLRFLLLSAALPYFVYFFIVFIPYIPLGLFGLIYIIGVLLFAPAGALAMQIIALVQERRQLIALWGGVRVTFSFILALLLIPICLLTSVIGDRHNLEIALTYLESSETTSEEYVDIVRLGRTLDNASGTMAINRSLLTDFVTVNNTPFLSAAYAAIVLDGRVMKTDEIEHLRHLYFDVPDTGETITDGLTVNNNNLTEVRLTGVETETSYDTRAGASRTWVHLTLKGGQNTANDEYVTLFTLPDGAYISDYYLDVGTERKYGILTDERAAMSVYENIVRVKKDPGVIHYISDRQLELRVFPFAISEIRRTGFEIIHSQSFEFSLDGQAVTLNAAHTPEEVPFQGGVLVSGALKQTLPKAGVREQSVYFIVDSSAHSSIDYQLSLIEDYASLNGITGAQVVFASYNLTEVPLSDVKQIAVTPRCGFNLALAIKKILTENGDDTVPVILFTSTNPAGAILPEHSSWLAKRFPDSPYYYRLRDDLTLVPYAFDDNHAEAPVAGSVIAPLLSYQGVYVWDNGQSEIVPLPSADRFTITGSQYIDALALDTALRSRPSMDAGTSLTMLRASFRTHVLTRQSAFIVVETVAQEDELWRTQELLMEQDSAMARETLDEPPLILLIVLFAGLAGVYVLIRARRRKTVAHME